MLRNIASTLNKIPRSINSMTQACLQVNPSDFNIQEYKWLSQATQDYKTLRCDSDLVNNVKLKEMSVLEPCEDDITHIAPYLKPTYNFAAYINKSDTLQQMLKMGVNLHKIEKIKDAPKFILGLNFESNMKPYIIFLHDLGLSIETIAHLITKNPFIFKEDIENLQVRINYLQSKKFTSEMIIRMVEKNPYLLSLETCVLDAKLGFLKKSFQLTGDELRDLVTNKPQIITYDENHIKKNIFVVKEEMGFTSEELKKIVLKCPVIFMKNRDFIRKTFNFLHIKMGIGLEVLTELPKVLTCRVHRLKQRHMFLEKLKRAQYDPKKPNYVSLVSLISGDDSYFCSEIAKSSIQTYNMFIKSI